MGNGLLTFIHSDTQYQDFFDDNEIIFYKDISDLTEKIKRYTKNDKEWRIIANKGHTKYHKYFNSSLVAKFIIERTFGIMFRAGALMPEPEIIKGSKIDVEYVGPLARSQRMEEAVAIERLYSLAMNVVQIDPSIMDNIDHDEAIRMRAKLLGVPKTVLRGSEEVDEMREQRAEQQAMMQQQQLAQQQAETALSQGKAMSELGKPEAQEGMDQAENSAREQGLM